MSDRIRIVQVSDTHFRRKCGQAKSCGWVVRRGHTSEMLTKSERTSEIVRCTSPLAQSVTAADTDLRRQELGLEDCP